MTRPIDFGRRAACHGLLLGSAAALAACGRSKTNLADNLPELDARQALRLYGNAPQRDGPINFQPGVKFVGDGAQSIRAMAPDGINWLLDAGARGVEQVREGDIIAVTGRCAGRVYAVQREGDLVRVALGPAEFTEFVRDCDIETDAAIDLADTAPLLMPKLPGLELQMDPTRPWRDTTPEEDMDELRQRVAMHGIDTGRLMARRALFRPDVHASRFGFRPAAGPTDLGDLTIVPVLGEGGVGMSAYARREGLFANFFVLVRLGRPRLRFRVRVNFGQIMEATISVGGSLGLKVGFVAVSEGGLESNYRVGSQLVPADWGIPDFGGIGDFFAASIQQRLSIQTAFSAKNSKLESVGDYELDGEIGFGYRNSTFGVLGPTIRTVNRSMLQSTKGLSLGANGIVVAHQMKVMVGIGAGGFKVGPYAGFNTSVGVTRGSDMARGVQEEPCKMATLVLSLRPGFGWQVPKWFAGAVNFFLGLVGLKKIPFEGGINGDDHKILNRTAWAPDTKMCRIEAAQQGSGGGGTTAPNSGSTGGGGPPPDTTPKPQPKAPPPPESGASTGEGGPSPGTPDPNLVCPDLDARQRLRDSGIDVEALCSKAGQGI